MKKNHLQKTFLSYVFLLLFITMVTNVISASNQNQSPVLQEDFTFEFKKVSLSGVLKDIEAKAPVKFVYNSELIRPDYIVTYKAKKQNLEKILKGILKPFFLDFDVSENQVIIKNVKKDNKQIGQLVKEPNQNSYLNEVNQLIALKIIEGTIFDEEGIGLPGVNVMIKGTTTGVITELEGNFRIETDIESPTLVISYVGYQSQEIVVVDNQVLRVILLPNNNKLDEILVIGYGTQKKSDLTGSVSSLKASEINAFPISNAMQGLNGRLTGVQVIQNSGAPGSSLGIRIRGGNSLQASNEPLYVVDGFPLTGNINAINPSDIESMEVLKDASATAIYGSRGANGVVIITTKSGKSGKGRIDYDGYYGTQQVTKTLDFLNAKEFATLMNERAANDKVSPYFTEQQIASFGEGTNWQKEIFRTAPIQNHSLNFSGGTEKINYSIGGSIFDQEGIIKNSSFGRASLRANISSYLNDRTKFTIGTIYSRNNQRSLQSDNSARGSGALSAAMVAPPTITPFNQDGGYNRVDIYSFSPNVLENPFAFINEITDRSIQNQLIINSALDIRLLKGLNLKVSGGLQNNDNQNDFYSTRAIRGTPVGLGRITQHKSVTYLNENLLAYSTKIGTKHSINGIAGFTIQNNEFRSLQASASGFPNDALSFYNLQSGTNPGVPQTGYSDWTILSYLGRVNYNYAEKLLLTLSARADGSSRFGKDNKWGYFPSTAIAYRLNQESFIKDLKAVSNLKLRASWGQTGNTALSPYQTLNLLNSAQVAFGNNIYIGFNPESTFPNPNLKWETTTQTDLGLDFGFKDEKIYGSLDVYNKNTKDLLASVLLPSSLGYVSTIKNIGAIRNRGIEFSINYLVLNNNNKHLNWNVGFNFFANRNKVIKLVDGSDEFGGSLSIPFNVPINLIRVGQPVGVFYTYQEDGLDEKGQIKFKDLNNDGIINANDRSIVGDPNPDYILGLNSSLNFKGFELSFILQRVFGNEIFNFNKSGVANSFNFGENQIKDMLNRWTPSNPNPNAPYPVLSVNTRFRESDRFIEDGSFLRLRNIVLAYNINAKSLLGLRSGQLYISGQNLLTVTNYSWYDPEVSTRGSGLTLGIDQAGYPNAKTVTMGLRLGI